MKKIAAFAPVALTLACLIIFPGCRKLIDVLFPGHGNDAVDCRIKTIRQGERSGIVYYNAHNDPDSIIFDMGYGAAQLYYFRYDQQHRLTESSAYYSAGEENYYYIHHYDYLGSDNIILDTMWFREAGEGATVSQLEYDIEGRVIKESERWISSDGEPASGDMEPEYYNYNEAGNLVVPYADEYDNKMSYLRTNKVWMFTVRDYSKNNLIGATGYNEQDLPLGFNNSYGRFLQFGHPNEIGYECD